METEEYRNHIHWFRRDLRLSDNPALLKSLENCDNFYALYILDEESQKKNSVNVQRFLIESLVCLNNNLKSLNSCLLVLKGSPLTTLPDIFEKWNITRLTFTLENGTYARQRDEIVLSLAEAANVEVHVENSNTLFDISRYAKINHGVTPLSFDEFEKAFNCLGNPPSPVECVTKQHLGNRGMATSNDLSHVNVFTLKEINTDEFGSSGSLLRGGEKEAMKLYHNFKQKILKHVTNNKKAWVHVPSKLSSYFNYGCVSVRTVYHELKQVANEFLDVRFFLKGLLIREFFLALGSDVADWEKLDSSTLCSNALWDNNVDLLNKFKQGKTGFPWIDAHISKLRQEGWISNEARQELAYFFTRGYLCLDWKEGVKFFDEHCIDADWNINVGSWLWVSNNSFFNEGCRSFCPIEQAKLKDSSGEHVRKYLPALRSLPDQYIYEPWNAPVDVQIQANCVIGKDYPERMIDHVLAKQVCVQKIKQYYNELSHAVPTCKNTVIHWFRKDLRLHDNPALLEAVRSGGRFFAVYVFDPVFFNGLEGSANHARFLLQCIKNLDDNLRKFGSKLCVLRGNHLHAFRQFFNTWSVTKLTVEEDSEPYAKKMENAVVALARKCDIDVVTKTSHTLYNVSKVIECNSGLVPFTFNGFISTIKKLGQPPEPAPAFESVFYHGCDMPVVNHTDIPSLEEFGLDEKNFKEGGDYWLGGESEALRRFNILQQKIKDGSLYSGDVANVVTPGVTALSPFMRFGCISPRFMYHTIAKLKENNNSQYAVRFLMKLLFRDFLFTLGHKNLFFDQVASNPVCVDVPWKPDNNFYQKWREAKTGFPWVDAVMTQLKKEGWAHHLGRQTTACFLTRGCLWVSWEEGFKAFQSLQLDFEWSLCAANWLMISCSSFFVNSEKYYCPVNTGKRIDPQGMLIRKYIPALRNFPAEYIYEPWKAPVEVQEAAGCIIGKHYPMRIIDHEEAKIVCANRLKSMVGELKTVFSTTVSIKEDEPKSKRKKLVECQ